MEEQHDLAKWLAGEMSGKELEAFENSSEFETYKKIRDYSTEMKVPDLDTQVMYQAIITNKKRKPVLQLRWLGRIAAILILGLGLTYLITTYTYTSEYAVAGKNTTFLLPDDSEVVLNSGSEIEYKKWNWDNDRSLELEGEAFFKVAKGEKFTVHTRLGKVTVLGTQFNVKSRNNNFEVECYEGKVQVTFGQQKVFLTPRQSIVIQNNQKIESMLPAGQNPSWLSNEIKFNANSLAEVIDELERQYAITIETSVQSASSFTGTLPKTDIETALQIIARTYHLKYTKTNQKIILLPG